MKTLITIVFLLMSMVSFGQINITPYLSAGIANHLTLNGLNYEAGIESEFFKRADLTLNYRHMKAEEEVTVSAFSANISFIAINRNNHRLMLGPGFSYGRYIRSTESDANDKDYKSTWFDLGKIQYDYTFKDRYRVGLKLSVSGEDGDGSTYFGIVAGCKL